MDTILIRDLTARGVIGLSEKERERPQDLLINVRLGTDTRTAALTDEIQFCVDYSEMTKAILALVETRRRFTVEALAEDIAALCLSHPLVETAQVRLEKTSAVRFVQAVGVEITRQKGV